jgi:hypothetical protein
LILRENCVRVLTHVNASANNEPAKNVDLDTALYSKYCKFQVQHTSRIHFLKNGGDGSQQFEIPEVENGDKCMPPLLVKHNSKLRKDAVPPPENYKRGESCAFDSARITAYEQANLAFKEDMTKPGKESIPKLRDLLVMDIAYLHLRNVKWKAKVPGHLGGEAAQRSDDDQSAKEDNEGGGVALRDDYAFPDWDFTDVDKIPWQELSHSLTGSKGLEKNDQPQYLLPALCIAYAAISSSKRCSKEIPEALSKFYEQCEAAVSVGTGESLDGFLHLTQPPDSGMPGQMWQRSNRRRDYTDAELAYITEVWKLARDEYQSRPSRATTPATPPHTKSPREEEGGPNSGPTLRPREAASKSDSPRAGDALSRPGGRIKQRATVKTQIKTNIGNRSLPAEGARAVTPEVGKEGKKTGPGRKRAVEAGDPSIPISSRTSRILLGQVSLNQRFPKSYISACPPKKSPVPKLTLGKAWHVVSALNHIIMHSFTTLQ